MSGQRPEAERQAHAYADHGWHTFALQPDSKVPFPGSRGFEDATTRHRQIESWWRSVPEANVAVRTGAPFGPDALDVDVSHGKPGPASLNKLIRADLVGKPQAIIRTPSGGNHLLYRGTDQRNGSLPDHGLDYRGQGGYIVAVPSVVGGRRYEVIRAERSADTCNWLAIKAHLEPEKQQRPAWQPREGKQADASHLAGWLAAQPEGSRNDRLFWSLNRAREAGDLATVDALADAAKAAGLSEREISATMRSAERTTPLPFAEPEQKEAG